MVALERLCCHADAYLLADSWRSSEKLLDFGISLLFLKCIALDIFLLDYSILGLIAAIIARSLDQCTDLLIN